MTAQIIDGKLIAQRVREEVAAKVAARTTTGGETNISRFGGRSVIRVYVSSNRKMRRTGNRFHQSASACGYFQR
jgi:methylenetetrahydrofolate dehydrogenase (NADP+)/methenyltetrahydrofolate cyclohydrolase